VPKRGKRCEAMEGLIEEARSTMEDIEDEGVLDVGMIINAQKVEHYEIAGYGTVIAFAQILGHDGAIHLLEQTLEDEKAADKTLTHLAQQGLNERAAHSSA